MEIINMTLVATFFSTAVSTLIVVTQSWHGRYSLDSNLADAQKFHKRPVPRVGGLSLAIGLLAAITWDLYATPSWLEENHAYFHVLLLLAAMPAFISGLLEDLTKGIAVKLRLLATFTSPLLACWMLGATLPRLDIWGVDVLFQIAPFAIFVSAFAVGGVTNSINIIDGFNGLAGTIGILMLAAIGLVAWQASDILIVKLAMAGIGTVFGFLLLNYPAGRLFMGDGGAYLLGFWIAEIAILTIVRNPNVSAWQILSICAYPVIEVLYSIYRKKIVRKMSPAVPDRLHFHMLVYRRLVCRFIPADSAQPWTRNAMVTCIIVICIGPLMLLSACYGDTIFGALIMIAVQISFYLAAYARLVRGHWCRNPVVALGLRAEHKAKSIQAIL